ncbi:MAG TPA: hypothetical protein VFA89_07435 [Terriglobales bacterium]|nr:hypothetical protein [Terriglobales bacterium]
MRWLAISAAVVLLALWMAAVAESSRLTLSAFLYTAAPEYDLQAWVKGGERFPQGAQILVHDSAAERPLASDFFASADPSVSFDGKRVLFSGKRKAQDPWEIWELSLADHSVKKIVADSNGCVRPLYLPDDRIVYSRKLNGHFVIQAGSPGKSEALGLTYAAGNSLPLDILHDGRVLFESEYPMGNGRASELYTVYSDGSGVESYRCDHGPSRHSGRQVASGDIVLVSGQRLARFTSSLAHEIKVPAPVGEYAGDVAELPDNRWLVAWRVDNSRFFEVRSWDARSGELRRVVQSKHTNLIQPVLVAPRPIPNRHPSALHHWKYANLLCLSAYTSKYAFAADSLATVRAYTQDESGHPKLLGAARIERDGSFYLRVPADQPLQLELLDSAGNSVKKEEGWFWMRRGEQRICVGCHAGPEVAPENAVPTVLLRSTIAADLTGDMAGSANGGQQ